MTTVTRKVTCRSATTLTAGEVAEAGRKERTQILGITGIVRRLKEDTSDFGPFVRFYGAFETVDVHSGEIVSAAQGIFPGVLQDLLFGTYVEGEEIHFAGILGVEPDKSPRAGVGYKWYYQPIVEGTVPDALTDMREQMMKALPKPEPKPPAK